MNNYEIDNTRTPRFVVETVLDAKRHTRFRLHEFLSKKISIVILISFFIFTVLFSVIGLALYGFDELYLYLPLTGIAIALMYVLRNLVVPCLTFRMSGSNQAHVGVVFYEAYCTVQIGQNKKDFEYESLYRISESDSDIYIFTSQSEVAIVDKAALTGADLEELKEFLRTRVKPKAYKCK